MAKTGKEAGVVGAAVAAALKGAVAETVPGVSVVPVAAAVAGCWDGLPTRDAKGALTMQPTEIALKVPMLRMVGPAGQELYAQQRLDVRLSADERRAMRELFDALQAMGVIVKSSASQGEAIKWLLRQLSMTRESAVKTA